MVKKHVRESEKMRNNSDSSRTQGYESQHNCHLEVAQK